MRRSALMALGLSAFAASCSQPTPPPEPPSAREVEAAIIYQRQNSGQLFRLKVGECVYDKTNKSFACAVSYKWSSIYLNTSQHPPYEGEICLNQRFDDDVWRYCMSKEAYNIIDRY